MAEPSWDDLPDADTAAFDDLPDAPGISAGERALNMIGRGAWALPGLVGLDKETADAGLAALTDPNKLGGTVGDRFSRYRQGGYQRSARVDRDNPITSGLVRGVTAAPGEALVLLAAPQAKLAQGASAVQKALTYGPRVGTLAAASEYGSTGYKPVGERSAGAAGAGVAGTLLGGAGAASLPYPGRVFGMEGPSFVDDLVSAEQKSQAAASSAAQSSSAATGGQGSATAGTTVLIKPPKRTLVGRALGEPEPLPEATWLRERGAPLTRGLDNPNSPYGQVEIASQSLSHSGPILRQQRQRALEGAMEIGWTEARPPGVTETVPKGNINDRYNWLKGLWDRAYSEIRGQQEPIFPAIGSQPLRSSEGKPGVFAEIVADPNEIWDDVARKQVAAFLDNQLTRLPKRDDGLTPRVDVGGLLKVRSEIKKQARLATKQNKMDHAAMLDRAAQAVTESIESQASPETVAALRSLDSNYRSFKVMESAVDRAGDAPGGISPAQFEAAVAGTIPGTSTYAAGGGGNMRQLSKAVRTVFDESGSPPTGARLLTLAPPWLQEMTVGPTILLRNHLAANATGGSAAARSQAAALAQAMQGQGRVPMMSAVNPGMDARGLAMVEAMRALTGRPGFAPAVADQESSR